MSCLTLPFLSYLVLSCLNLVLSCPNPCLYLVFVLILSCLFLFDALFTLSCLSGVLSRFVLFGALSRLMSCLMSWFF